MLSQAGNGPLLYVIILSVKALAHFRGGFKRKKCITVLLTHCSLMLAVPAVGASWMATYLTEAGNDYNSGPLKYIH